MNTTQFAPKFKFYQLFPGIFLTEIDGNNDLAYTFLRAQEFYESVNPNIQGKNFTFKEYQDWYCSQSKDGSFSYGNDWKGFNIPFTAINDCYSINTERLPQDLFFLDLCEKAKNLNGEKYYMLGVRKGDTNTLDHEIAHGFFTTNLSYNIDMNVLVLSLPKDIYQYLSNYLTDIGYGQNVHVDEIQAYMATGLRSSMDHDMLTPYMKPFQEVFQKYAGNFDFKNISPIINTM